MKSGPSPPGTATIATQMLWRGDKETTASQYQGRIGISEPDFPGSEQLLLSQNNEGAIHTPIHAKQDGKALISSTSRKRHASKFEAKTKQLVEEEGMSFRRMQSQHKQKVVDKISPIATNQTKPGPETEDSEVFHSTDLDTYRKSAVHLHLEGPDVLVIPTEDAKWYESQNSEDPSLEDSQKLTTSSLTSIPSNSGEQKSGSKGTKKVQFVKEALILNAALEGDLTLLKDCVKEVSSYPYMAIV